MSEQEIQAYCETNGVPCKQSGGKLKVLDMTQIPSAMRACLDERGMFKGSAAADEPAEEPEAEPKEPEEVDDLSGLTVAELKDKARELEIQGFSSMNKAELVEAVAGASK